MNPKAWPLLRLFCLLPITILCSTQATLFAQSLLCEREAISVYYVTNKTKSAEDHDEWRIYLDVRNRGNIDLYYKARTDNDPNATIQEFQLVPSYLTVTVLNAIDTYAGQPFHVHGNPLLLQITTDSTMILKVPPKRFEKHIKTRTKKGEEPRLTGEFTAVLLSLEEIKKYRLNESGIRH